MLSEEIASYFCLGAIEVVLQRKSEIFQELSANLPLTDQFLR